MSTKPEELLLDSLVEAVTIWATNHDNIHFMGRVDGVPSEKCLELRESLEKRFEQIDKLRLGSNQPTFGVDVNVLAIKNAKELVPGEVNADGATAKRNEVAERSTQFDGNSNIEGKSLLLIAAPSVDFSSVAAGTLKSLGYEEALRRSARLIVESHDLSKYLDILTEAGAIAWIEGASESSSMSEGHAILVAIAALATGQDQLGSELWRVCLIPDLGKDGIAERVRANRKVVRILSAPVAMRNLDERLSLAGVKLTQVTRKVSKFLGMQNLSLVERWCQGIVSEGGGELSFEKWNLDDGDALFIDDLRVIPFRDPNGAVISKSKLLQDGNHNHSDPLYAVMKFNLDGEPSKAPTVAIEWETDPTKTAAVAQWVVSLVVPQAYREADQEPLIVKNVKGDKRKLNFKIDINREDLPEGVGDSGLLVCLEVAALDEDDAPVVLRQSNEEAIVESQEFELRFTDVDLPPVTKSRRDNSVSPSEASLSVAVSEESVAYVESFIFKDFARVLDIEFTEPGDKPRVLQTRSVRTIPSLIAVQSRIVSDGLLPLVARYRGRTGSIIDPTLIEYEELKLPSTLVSARAKFLDQLEDATSGRGRRLVEVAVWTEDLSSSLDKYIEEFEKALVSFSEESIIDLLRLDTFEVVLEDRDGDVATSIVLPTHPLRAAWIREYVLELDAWTKSIHQIPLDERTDQVDLGLVRRISPNNYPFIVGQSDGQLVVYGEEIAFGYGFYANPMNPDYDVIMSMVLGILDSERSSSIDEIRISNLGRVVDKFLETEKNSEVLSLLTLNAGDGRLISSVLDRFFEDETDDNDALAKYRLSIQAYADRFPFSNPVDKLNDLQIRRSGATRPGLSHLAPPVGVSIRDRTTLSDDAENVHLAVALGIAAGEISTRVFKYPRRAHMNGVITGTQTEKGTESENWFTSAHLGFEGDAPLVKLHRNYLQAIGEHRSGGNGQVGIQVKLSPELKLELRRMHERADRVVTIDRFVGLDWFEEAQSYGLGATYILDYTPDFVEGMADRLIVTTKYRDEIVRVVGAAMREMGLSLLGSETAVIDALGLISGRLALNLLARNPQAHEAVGLAVTISYLKADGKLDGWVVIPVDSHLEIFGIDAQNKSENGRRCDMLLVRFSEGHLEIRCVEVKERQGGNVPDKLVDRIVSQLNNTAEILMNRFLQAGNSRIDRKVQIAHFSSILHHYIDKAHSQGLIDGDQWLKYHEGADCFDSGHFSISREGYVVALQGAPREIRHEDGIPIQVLTEVDLAGTQFTTKVEESTRLVVSDSEPVRTNPKTSGIKSNSSHPDEEPPATSCNEPNTPDTPPESGGAAEVDKPDTTDGVFGEKADEVANETTPIVDVSPDSGEKLSSGAGPKSVLVELGRDLANQPVNWSVSTKGSPHAFILGITGQGKSVTTRHIVDSYAKQGLPSVIIDLHGDMAASPPIGAKVIDVRTNGLGFSPFQLSGQLQADVNDSAFEIAEIVGYVFGLGEIQTMHVYRAMSNAYKSLGWVDGEKGERLPTMAEFAAAVEAVEAGARGKNARERLTPFTDFGLFRDEDVDDFDPTGGGRGLVIDLHGITNDIVLRAAMSFILRKIYRDMFIWDQDSTLKLAIVIDEAHRFANDTTLPKLMKEGRKYGVSCLVASQSISDFNKEVTGNAGTKIVFRTNFPESKKVADILRGAGKNDLSRTIEQLNVGEAFVSTPESTVARRTKMNGDVD
jgi:hypothetical protein